MNASAIKSRLSQLIAVAAIIVVGAVVILVTTSGPPSVSSTASTSGSSGSGDAVDIKNFKFIPPDLTVKAGTKLAVTNEDTAEHTLTSDDGAFDSGDLGQGDKATITLSKPGTFTYHCDFHAFMTGTITVK